MAIWEDLKLDHGFTARYSSVQRYVLSLGRESGHEARVRIDTPKERDYYRHGGILQYVLRQLAAKAA